MYANINLLNLPPKNIKIIAAIKNELARVPFDKVSINKIVQKLVYQGSFTNTLKTKLIC